MSRATVSALVVLRVPRGGPAPTESDARAALELDRSALRMPANPHVTDFAMAGPYAITVEGAELDEYVVWER